MNRPQNHIQICGEKILLPPLTRGLSWRCHDWGRENYLFSENIISPSVFCFAKSTSLVRGRKGICCNIKGLHYSPAGSDSASAHCIRRGVHRTPAPPPQNHIKIPGGHRNPPLQTRCENYGNPHGENQLRSLFEGAVILKK